MSIRRVLRVSKDYVGNLRPVYDYDLTFSH